MGRAGHHRFPGPLEVRQRGPHHPGGTQEVHRNHPLPLVSGHLAERTAGVDPGGGEYRLQLVAGGCHQGRDGVLGGDPVGQIGLHMIHVEQGSIAVPGPARTRSGSPGSSRRV